MRPYTQPMLEGLSEGIKLRDKGMTRALSNPAQDIWKEAAYLWLSNLPAGRELTSLDLTEAIGMPPASHNLVGATIRAAATRGLIAPTARFIQSTRPIAHATAIRVWVAL